jgi:hypothetical protein
MPPNDIFSIFYSSAQLGLHLAGLRSKKKCVYNPADLQVALSEIQGGIPKIRGSEQVKYPKVQLTVMIK